MEFATEVPDGYEAGQEYQMKLTPILLAVALMAVGAMAQAQKVSIPGSSSYVSTTNKEDGGGKGDDGGKHDDDGGKHDGDGGKHDGGGKPQCTPEPISIIGLGIAGLGLLRARMKQPA